LTRTLCECASKRLAYCCIFAIQIALQIADEVRTGYRLDIVCTSKAS
jgi:hypothetical protein